MGNTVLITGGSSGIGAACALLFAEKGWDVAIGCHSEGSLSRGGEPVAAAAREKGVRAGCFVADVADFEAAGRLISAATEAFGGIDVLVNAAGITRDGPVARMSEEQFDAVLATNLKGAFNTIRHITPQMMKKRAGKIINITSVVGITGNRGQANYAASKSGLIGLTKSVAKELGGRGITCNAVAPGFIETAMTDRMPEKAREALLNATALGRPGRPEEVAEAVFFLATSSFITGHVLVVDGMLG
ncbi:MAG: 3-oxoacyl-ACP reductase FabG [Oscillospiraceae bacterium]|jgi:3-oxoacyl-[acyl-carrier protein] reductase|nr:3-oxoacyl-ACP reductase FabG [Oscillospiraceae bacterium]